MFLICAKLKPEVPALFFATRLLNRVMAFLCCAFVRVMHILTQCLSHNLHFTILFVSYKLFLIKRLSAFPLDPFATICAYTFSSVRTPIAHCDHCVSMFAFLNHRYPPIHLLWSKCLFDQSIPCF